MFDQFGLPTNTGRSASLGGHSAKYLPKASMNRPNQELKEDAVGLRDTPSGRGESSQTFLGWHWVNNNSLA